MQIRKNQVLALLVVFPLLGSSLALQLDTADVKDAAKSVKQAAAKALPNLDNVAAAATSVLTIPTKAPAPIGTKDAPVDGLDGKPHAGPFVDSSSTSDKAPAVAAKDTTTTRPKPKKPDVENGVMNDENRQAPRRGTAGTEGGVSEKERLSEAGGAKRPEAPKEAPQLPAGDTARLGLKSTEDVKKMLVDDAAGAVDKPRGAAGIEVSFTNRA